MPIRTRDKVGGVPQIIIIPPSYQACPEPAEGKEARPDGEAIETRDKVGGDGQKSLANTALKAAFGTPPVGPGLRPAVLDDTSAPAWA